MEEADFLCDRIAIMDRGKFVAMDSPARLKDILGGDVVSLEIEGDSDALVKQINSLDWIKNMARHDETLSLTMEKGERRIPELITVAKENGVNVTCVHLRKPSLEDVFIHFTGKTIREEEASQTERNLAMIRARMGRRMGRR
jgi:ABC-2 type transport system ATP-binding protein